MLRKDSLGFTRESKSPHSRRVSIPVPKYNAMEGKLMDKILRDYGERLSRHPR